MIIAALMNAGLLAVLFLVALTTQEETPVFKEPVVTQTESVKQEHKELFTPSQEKTLDLSHLQLPTPEPVVQTSKSPLPLEPQRTPLQKREERKVLVKKGDSLEKIARAHEVSMDDLIQLNQLSGSFLRVGQELKLPKQKMKRQAPQKETVSSEEFYTVKVGDNPWTIAMKHHIKVEELLRLNQLNEQKAKRLKPGDRLRVR